MKIASLEIAGYQLRHARPVGGAAHREGWHVRLRAQDGRVGFGEAAPWRGFGSSSAEVERALNEARAELAGLDLREVADVRTWVTRRKRVPEAANAVEGAMLDLLAQERQVPLARLLAPRAAAQVTTHALVHDVESARDAVSRGFATLKVKLGGAALDLTPFAELGAALRVDANGAFGAEAAVRFLEGAPPLAWFEQPCAARDLAGLRFVRERTGVRVAADESVHDLASLRAVIDARAADVVVLKPMFVGGLLASLELAAEARRAGLEVHVTHALGSAIDRAASIHLACALAIDGDCGLAPHLAEDVAALGDGGRVIVAPTAPGLGVRLGGER